MIEDLVANDASHLEALLARYRVYDHVAVDTDEMLRIKNTILILDGIAVSVANA